MSESLQLTTHSLFTQYFFYKTYIFFSGVSCRERVCIVVNVASKWGKTDVNYTELVQLHEKYGPQGLSILAFPCNQFGGQVFCLVCFIIAYNLPTVSNIGNRWLYLTSRSWTFNSFIMKCTMFLITRSQEQRLKSRNLLRGTGLNSTCSPRSKSMEMMHIHCGISSSPNKEALLETLSSGISPNF